MPDLLSSLPEPDRVAAMHSLIAFLNTQREPYQEIKASGANPVPLEFHERGNSEQGSRLFHSVGCVACHEPDPEFDVPQVPVSDLDKMIDSLDPEELEKLGLSSSARRVPSITFPNLRDQPNHPAKYSRQSLTYFLLNPELTHPGGRMPSLGLKPVDAADIAAYLMESNSPTRTAGTSRSGDARLAAQGRQLFDELRCNNCHQLLPTNKLA